MNNKSDESFPEADQVSGDDSIDLWRVIAPLKQQWAWVLGAATLAGFVGWACSYLVTPKFVSTTTFIPPQQQQSVAAAALSSLGALSGFGAGAVKSPSDEYISLMRSVTVSDRIIDRFKLMQSYDEKYRFGARKRLTENVQIALGKKDGLISVMVEDEDPARAAAMANQYVDELRRMTSILAVSEAQQRRVFFERQMESTQLRLTAAQTALQESGFNAGAIKAEPKSAADEYARLRAEMTSADVRLQTLRTSLAESAPEVQQQMARLQALRAQVDQLERATTADSKAPSYITKYREFKYQETLFDLLAKQYELARVDESREGALIQVVDPAQPAELMSKPKRLLIAAEAFLVGALAMAIWLITRDRRRSTMAAAGESAIALHA